MSRTLSLSLLIRVMMLAFLTLSFAALPALTDDAWGAEVVGKISKQRADAYGTAPGEGRERKFPRYDVVFGEFIETDGGAALLIDMKDGTELFIGERAELVIDEFVYDPQTNEGKAVYNFTVGTLRFVSGDMNDAGVTIATPNAYIGIRGSEAFIFVTPEGNTTVNVTKGSFRVRSRERPDVPAIEVEANQNVSVEGAASFSPVATGFRVPEYEHTPDSPDFSDDVSDLREGSGFDRAKDGEVGGSRSESGTDSGSHDHID